MHKPNRLRELRRVMGASWEHHRDKNEKSASPFGQWLNGFSLRLVATLAAAIAILTAAGCKKAAPPPPPPPIVQVMDLTTTNVPLSTELGWLGVALPERKTRSLCPLFPPVQPVIINR